LKKEEKKDKTYIPQSTVAPCCGTKGETTETQEEIHRAGGASVSTDSFSSATACTQVQISSRTREYVEALRPPSELKNASVATG